MNYTRKNIFKNITTAIATLMFVLAIPVSNISATGMNFSVKSIIPANQLDKSKTYYDLLVKPNDKQDIEVLLTNDTPNDLTVMPSINSAKTNNIGVVEYNQNDIPKDKSLKYDMAEIATTDKEVVVKANSEYRLKIHINVPAEQFKGVVAGGITLQQKDKDSKGASEGVSIKNKYSYVIGLVLHEDQAAVEPDMLLNSVKAGQFNSRNIIFSNLQNYTPTYISNLSVKTEVTRIDDSSKKILLSSNDKDMQVAPNTNFNYMTRLNGEKFRAGKYNMHLIATSGKYKWEFNKEFEITSAEASQFNKSDVDIEDYTWIYLLAGAVLVLLIILFFVWKKKKKDKEEQKVANI
ncbi:MAG: DUF916 and DUF3324 domain-containing protein [Clostridioides sp.]|jgi:LPXTG-motif cell wall-anchored protein|nr:DUF916 and DUF3324 domain-containing protein [Clostridioides sp.]